jgi:hypothetical protein
MGGGPPLAHGMQGNIQAISGQYVAYFVNIRVKWLGI